MSFSERKLGTEHFEVDSANNDVHVKVDNEMRNEKINNCQTNLEFCALQ